MPELLIRRTDVPTKGRTPRKSLKPAARLHRSGTLYFSVRATEVLGRSEDCLVTVTFDEDTKILKFRVADNAAGLPRGVSEADCFMMRIAKGKNEQTHRPQAKICLQSLFHYIGFARDGSQNFEIVKMEPVEHSVSVRLPKEQFASAASAA